MTIERVLLRRRRIDPWILAGGMATLAIMQTSGKAAFVFFTLCGIYLAAIRHRTIRQAPPAFSVVLVLWTIWQIGLSFVRAEGIAGNRGLSYAAIELAVLFLPLGLCLVPRPLDALALGARVGLLALVVLTPIQFALTGTRVGLGANEALFAFVAGVAGLAARFPIERPLRLLPNGRFWTYLAGVPILLSGTRAALVLILMVAVLDLVRLAGGWRRDRRRALMILAGVAAVVAVVAVPVSRMVADRFEDGVVELQTFEATGVAKGSADVRVVMWSSAMQVLAEHPLTGVGGTMRMERVAEKAGVNAYMVRYYEHLHNLFLDEALSSGLIGLVLLLSVFGTFLATVFRQSRNRLIRETAVVLVAFVFLFGSFHGVLLNEWTLIVLFGTISTLLTTLRRRQRAEAIRSASPARI